jgi:hypothetical protein
MGLLLAGYLSLFLFPLEPDAGPWRFLPGDPVFDGLVRWDSGWYRSISARGYFFEDLRNENIHFLPVYPLLVRAVMSAAPGSASSQAAFAYAAILVSHIAFYFAIVGVRVLANAKAGEVSARRTVWLMCLFPYSFFLGAAYSESMYLAFAVWSFVFAERGRWAPAACLAALASATRIPGLFVGVSVALIYLARPRARTFALSKDAFWLLIAPMGCAVYAVYLGLRFDDPMILVNVSTHLPSHYEHGSAMHIRHVFEQSLDMTNAIERLTILSSIVIFAFVSWMSVIAGQRFGVAYAFFPMASVTLASMYTLDANGRYASVLFPVFLAAATTLSQPAYRVVCAVSAALGTGLYALFAQWHHIT